MKRSLLVVCLLVGCAVGCAGKSQRADAPKSEAETAAELLSQGERLAHSGQSVRAEQYFLAAENSGADAERVFELVVATCVDSGRLGSALMHVERRLRRHPTTPHLRQLAASLYLALGHERAAREQIVVLEGFALNQPEALLFLGEYFERHAGDEVRALEYYDAYLSKMGKAAPFWVQATTERLRHRSRVESSHQQVLPARSQAAPPHDEKPPHDETPPRDETQPHDEDAVSDDALSDDAVSNDAVSNDAVSNDAVSNGQVAPSDDLEPGNVPSPPTQVEATETLPANSSRGVR